MTEETKDFAAFEAQANAPEEVKPDDAAPEKVEEKPEPKPDDDTLELTDDDEAVDVEDEEGGEEETDSEGRKRRSKPAKERIAELTAARREAERRAADLEERLAKLEKGSEPEAKAPEAPNPDDFEYGESDPKYIDALTDYKIEKRDFEANKTRSEAEAAQQEQQRFVSQIEQGVAKAEAAAKAKYEDFDDRIAEVVEARGGKALPPMLTIGTGVSPVGGDIIYRLATDAEASARLESLAEGGQKTSSQFAMAFGELEAEYLSDDSDADLDMTDELDKMRMMGRLRARASGKTAKEPKAEIRPTNAPEPPKHRARGGSGRFEVDARTSDFAAFEKKVNGAR